MSDFRKAEFSSKKAPRCGSPIDIAPFNWIPGPLWFAIKVAAVLFVFLWVRATFPRYRYDQLMRLGWKIFLPVSLVAVVVVSGAVVAFDLAPVKG